MSVIVGPRPAGRARRPEAGAPPHPLRHERERLHALAPAHEVGPYRGRRHRQVPPARRLGGVRHHGAPGPAVLYARAPESTAMATSAPSTADGAAAMRYTERASTRRPWNCSLTWTRRRSTSSRTTTRSLEEPVVLPARFPNLLVNGSQGIAVGYGHEHPAAQNLRETIDATCLMLDNPDVTTEELMKALPGPDFPRAASSWARRASSTPTRRAAARSPCAPAARLRRRRTAAAPSS